MNLDDEFKIGTRIIGKKYPPFIIPEIGRNYKFIKPQYIETIVDQINNLKNA